MNAPASTPGRSGSELQVRVISAVILLVLVGVDLWLGGWWFVGLALLVGLGLYREWWRLVSLTPWPGGRKARFQLGGAVYIVAAVLALLHIQSVAGSAGLLVAMALVWATDIGAYFAGRALGGPKIAPAISPSKTWAGLGGGIVAACLTLYVAKQFDLLRVTDSLDNSYNLQVRTLAAALVAIVAQAGDFLESWLKRQAGVKDSGSLIPGHGGLLDRLDGLLPAAILIALWLLVVVQ